LVYLLPNAHNKADPEKRCTAVKVSTRHLVTSAHCLVSESGLLEDNLEKPNAKLELSNFGERDVTDTSLWHSGYIKSIRTSPGYEDAVAQCASDAIDHGEPILCKDRWNMPAELAVVEFVSDLPAQWPLAKLDLHPVAVGETVTLVGYGKQVSRFGFESKAKKKFSHEVVRDWEGMKPFINETNVDSTVAGMAELTFVTHGTMNPNADIGSTAGLMPGDSGGQGEVAALVAVLVFEGVLPLVKGFPRYRRDFINFSVAILLISVRTRSSPGFGVWSPSGRADEASLLMEFIKFLVDGRRLSAKVE
jgi:hypothetical protein